MRAAIAKKIVVTMLMLAAFGLLRMPFEDRLQKRLESDGLLPVPPGIGMLDQMGQSAFLATLGGARSLVGIYMTLMAVDGWYYQNWAQVDKNYSVVTSLKPDDIDAWVVRSWHQAYNASANMEIRGDWREFKQPTEQTRKEVAHRYVLRGADILRSGIQNNPESGKLYQELGFTLWKKAGDPCAAAEAYKMAKDLPGSMAFTARFYGYALAECPGSAREAYDYLLDLYRVPGEKHHLPSVIVAIKDLETKLDVPFILRIRDPDPDERLRKNLEQNQTNSYMPWLR